MLDAGRCHMCGYSLRGLAPQGSCPECATAYTPETARRLRPWPRPAGFCMQLGWPIALFAGACLLVRVLGIDITPKYEWGGMATLFYIMVGAALLAIIPINTWYEVRRMLKRSLPEQVRTRGPVAVMRAIGTVVCALTALALLAPFLYVAGFFLLAIAS